MQPQIPDHIRQLANKWIDGTITATERDVLLDWYAQEVPAEVSWDSADTAEEAMEERMYVILQNRLQPRLTATRYNIRKRLLQAAAVLVLVFAGWAGIYKWQQKSTTVITSAGGVRKMILPDSSIVWLKGNSSLTYHRNFGKAARLVELTGEALFEIKKDPARPFIVESGQYTTQVLGTSFNIKDETGPHRFSLLVLTGKVQIVRKNTKEKTTPLLITPDYQFMGDNRQSAVIKASNAERVQSMNGTEYDMNFNHTAFPEIIQRIGHKFDVTFAGDYQQFADCRITADITDQSLVNSLKLITMAINAAYEIKNGTIIITGNGCK